MDNPNWIKSLSVRMTSGGLILAGIASLWAAAGRFTINGFVVELSRNAPAYVPVALIAFSLLIIGVGLCMLISREVTDPKDKNRAYTAALILGVGVFSGMTYWLFIERPDRNLISRWAYEYGDDYGEVTLDLTQVRKYMGQSLFVSAQCGSPHATAVDGVMLSHWTPDNTSAKIIVPMPRLGPQLRLGDEVVYSVWTLPGDTSAAFSVENPDGLAAAGAFRLTHRSIDASISVASRASIMRAITELDAADRGSLMNQLGTTAVTSR